MASDKKKEEIVLKNIPQDVFESVQDDLKHFFVSFCEVFEEGGSPEIRPLGSGTLVDIAGNKGILTAAHVWNAIKKHGTINLILSDRTVTAVSINCEHVVALEIWADEEPEWGPDLAFLRLAQKDVETIGAIKSFLNLSKQKDDLGDAFPNYDKGLWMVFGLVGEFCSQTHNAKNKVATFTARCECFFTTIHETHQRAGYDYVDGGVDFGLEGVPSSFGGVSGGGVWEIELSKNADGVLSWTGNRSFRGVAFWESDWENHGKRIRAHGPKSIYQVAWDKWALPLE